MENKDLYKNVIRRDTVQCNICNQVMIVYVFKDGSYRTIHKHKGLEYVPSNYVALNEPDEIENMR